MPGFTQENIYRYAVHAENSAAPRENKKADLCHLEFALAATGSERCWQCTCAVFTAILKVLLNYKERVIL